MAQFIPSINSCLNEMQSGEKRFARRLDAFLEEDYLCWYDLPLGSRQRYSDFIVLHPGRGLLLLEVKDWRLEIIQRIDRKKAEIITPSGLKSVANPLEQVRQCTYQLIDQLERDSQLIHPSGIYKGKLVCPYGYGVVLSYITRKQFDSTDLNEVLPGHQVICKDEMAENSNVEEFQKRLWDMFNSPFPCLMTLPQIDRIRWHLFPEIRIGDRPQYDADNPIEKAPGIVRVMDLQQEQLARSLGEGHRVIHGVSGSGKTLILGYRCLHLAKTTQDPVLVLCFNITLAAWLRSMMAAKSIDHLVHVYHFHDWCGKQLKKYHIPKPKWGDDYLDKLIDTVITAVENDRIPKDQYGSLIIDEAQDFEENWLKLVVQMVNPETNSLLVLYDDAQSIYKKGTLNFPLSRVGVHARGRTTIFKKNYRNTTEIVDFAYHFVNFYLNFRPLDQEGELGDKIPLIQPHAIERHGPVPQLKQLSSFEEEAKHIVADFKMRHEAGSN